MFGSCFRAAGVLGGSFIVGVALAASPGDFKVSPGILAGKSTSAGALHRKLKYGPPVAGYDSVANFTGTFHAAGVDSNGNPQSHWPWTMLGNAPNRGGTTEIDAPIFPVAVRLLDANGKQAYDPTSGAKLYVTAQTLVDPVVSSPVFSFASFTSSSRPTQFTDAVQRAEFWSSMSPSWHTLLSPRVVGGEERKSESENPYVMSVPLGSYFYALNNDGSCCAFLLLDVNEFQALLFPAAYPVDTSTLIGRAELAGEMTTRGIATWLFPNTYLYEGVSDGMPQNCCILGFHSFDEEPGIPKNNNETRAYVMNYASWISPGIFGGGLADVTALSHELAETFNDPFVTAIDNLNLTPWWLSPNGNCQNDMEDGDVIENLPNGVYPMRLHGVTYHPQNVALLQWFETHRDSNALGGAFSYPDPSVLTQAAVSQTVNCTGPLK